MEALNQFFWFGYLVDSPSSPLEDQDLLRLASMLPRVQAMQPDELMKVGVDAWLSAIDAAIPRTGSLVVPLSGGMRLPCVARRDTPSEALDQRDHLHLRSSRGSRSPHSYPGRRASRRSALCLRHARTPFQRGSGPRRRAENIGPRRDSGTPAVTTHRRQDRAPTGSRERLLRRYGGRVPSPAGPERKLARRGQGIRGMEQVLQLHAAHFARLQPRIFHASGAPGESVSSRA